MKRGLIITFCLILVLTISLPFVSAGLLDWFKDIFVGGITGKVTCDSNNLIYCSNEFQCTNASGVWCSSTGNCQSSCPTCSDSDSENYYFQGTVTWSFANGSSQTFTDYCDTSTRLAEQTCSGNSPETGFFTCNTTCTDGKCDFGAAECDSKSDCGTDGYVGPYYCHNSTGVYQNYTNYVCSNPGTTDAECSTYISPQLIDKCGSDEECIYGQSSCQPKTTNETACSDSDGGDYDVKGTTSWNNQSGSGSDTDVCNGNSLVEYFCSNNQLSVALYACPNGCSDGKCIQTDSSGSLATTSPSATTTSSSSPTTSTTSTTSSSDSSISDYSSSGNYQESTTIVEDGRQIEVQTNEEIFGNEVKKEEKRSFVDENGNKVTIITVIIIETGKGEEGREVKRKIETDDGKEFIFKTRTEQGEGGKMVTEFIEVEGAEARTILEIKEETEEGKLKIKVKLSTGDEQELVTQPDEALQTALIELGTTNDLVFELKEISEKGVTKAVFSAKVAKPGRFLGIFSTQLDLETLVDTKTGDIIETKKPWWAFLVSEDDKAVVCHVSDDGKNTIEIAVSAVKSHLSHGDSVGECVKVDEPVEEINDIETCSDGTLNFQCSSTKPLFCTVENETLIDNCQACGCPLGQICESGGSCGTEYTNNTFGLNLTNGTNSSG